VTDGPTPLQGFLAGRFVPSRSGEYFDAVNPSDRSDIVARVPGGAPEDASAAALAASDAFAGWAARSGPDRGEHLHRWAGSIAARAGELADAMSREVGKPISEARGEVARCAAILRYAAGEAVREVGEVIPSQTADALQFTLREPLGPVGLVTPWNFPLAIPLWKAAPALAFGNTVVLKPAEESSRMASMLAETAAAAGLPPGVFNVVFGRGEIVGEALLSHELIRAISFTGSTAVGARVARIASERNIRYQTETGGKNAVVVLADADLDRAAALTAAGAMRFAGQKCTATSRAIVLPEARSGFIDRLRREIAKLGLGPVNDPACAVGPLIREESRDRAESALRSLEAERVTGGKRPGGPTFDRGFFLEPAVVADVNPDSNVARDELFAPILAILEAGDPDEAAALANRTRFGLSASVFTRDLSLALRFIRSLDAGLVRVNGDTTGVDPHAPFGGKKASSSGSREQGRSARDFYTEIKTVQIHP
jgi:acyl-CoA reductase-like NAD-dependent aldehyde dehydrogenase